MANDNYRILVVDDEPLIRKSLYEILRIEGYIANMAENFEEAIEKLKAKPFDIVIADMKMPGADGIELLKFTKTNFPHITVVIITAFGNIETAVEAMRLGAFDYVTKPINDNEIKIIIQRIREHNRLLEENINLRKRLSATSRDRFCNIVGQDEKMQKIYTMIEAIANTKATVLLRGESGTGKRLVALAIHSNDQLRKDRPFVEISCGALPETLLESELFGHVRGAFTGAIKDKLGRFELADTGTILLDEIDAFSPALQVKLLRVLQEGEFERVGDTKTIKVNVRIIAATNQNLEELIKNGRFREDLYYRLNVISIDVPPLRERRSDIKLLAEHFLQKHAPSNRQRKIKGLNKEVLEILKGYHWPGNVRELENVIERAIIMAKGDEITKENLPEALCKDHMLNKLSTTNNDKTLKEVLAEPEREIILRILQEVKWNRKKAASKLGINRTTLYNKMKRFGISKEKGYREFIHKA